jgi:LPXTG-motif cell wall-anchored protein
MLTGIAIVAMGHDYNGPGASAITLGIVGLVVLILAGVYGRKNR